MTIFTNVAKNKKFASFYFTSSNLVVMLWRQLKILSGNGRIKLLLNILRINGSKNSVPITNLENKRGCVHPSEADDNQLKVISGTDPLKITREVI